jgi:hypothetical protein
MPGVSPDSFMIIMQGYTKNSQHVYHYDSVIEGADPATFKILRLSNAYIYSNDKNHVYYDGKISDSIFMIKDQSKYVRLKGRIILNVQGSGEAYYLNSDYPIIHYLGRPNNAFSVMRFEGIGITNADLNKIPLSLDYLSGADSDGDGLPNAFELAVGSNPISSDADNDGYGDRLEIENGYMPNSNEKYKIDPSYAKRKGGRILLQVEGKGEAWYVNPVDDKRYYLGRPADAFNIMKNLGLGISKEDLNKLSKLSSTPEKSQSITYAAAISTGQPFHCEFKIGFAGAWNKAEADIIGKDYILTETLGGPTEVVNMKIKSARKDGSAYSWVDGDDDSDHRKLDIAKYETETSKLLGYSNNFDGFGLFFEAPPQDATCSPITSMSIHIPAREYVDFFDQIFEIIKKENEKQATAIDSLTFGVLLPPYDGYSVVKSTQGIGSDQLHQNLTFNLNNPNELIYIDEESVNKNPTKCQTGSCILAATTPQGTKVYSEMEYMNGKSQIKYFTRIADVAISFHATEQTSGKYDRITFSASHLSSFVDSFQTITKDEVKKIPEDEIYY